MKKKHRKRNKGRRNIEREKMKNIDIGIKEIHRKRNVEETQKEKCRRNIERVMQEKHKETHN